MYCGLNGHVAPYDNVQVVRVYVPEEYVRDKNEDYDLALLVLERPIDLQIG